MGNMLVCVAARLEEAVQFFRDDPLPARIVRSAENNAAALSNDPANLVKDYGIFWDMLDHLRAQYAGERLIGKREPEHRALNHRTRELAAVSELFDQNVEGYRALGQRPDDPARTAADVEHLAVTIDHGGHVVVPRPLPVALKRDRAVTSPIIVVCRHYRIPEPPERPECPYVGEPKFQDAGVRAAMNSRLVDEWNLSNAPTFGVGADKNLLQDIEISGSKGLPGNRASAVQPVAAGKVVNLQAEPPAKEGVQDTAQQVPAHRHVSRTARNIAGSDDNFSAIPCAPHVLDKRRLVREVCVHSKYVAPAGCAKPAE